jgi:DMSO/TMAO reductase YedYZ molybdopterin-dependent catalytic subunit
MADTPFIARGFHRTRPAHNADRLPPGQYETRDFPVLSAGPTPRVDLAAWDFSIAGVNGKSKTWSWEEFKALPHDTPTVDIHCVTKWSKFDTKWEGISVDTLLDGARGAGVADGKFVMAFSDGGYTTNLPLADVTNGKAWVVFSFDGAPLDPEHGGPIRLLVPHLYFWKSAKWVRGLRMMSGDEPGFWEKLGYHDRGDPWREQRYQGDP